MLLRTASLPACATCGWLILLALTAGCGEIAPPPAEPPTPPPSAATPAAGSATDTPHPTSPTASAAAPTTAPLTPEPSPTLGTAPASSTVVAHITVDWTERHQTLVGFGGTMSWIHPPREKREELFDLLFKRLGASVLRVQALGAETGDEGALEPVNDNDDSLVFDWSKFPIRETEAKNAVIIAAAQARGVKTVIPTAWSPPGWMKTSNSRVGGSLQPDRLNEYAECWAAYLIGLKREFRLEVPYISIQNEPDLTYTYPTCGIGPELYAQAADTVARRLQAEKLSTQVLGPDTCRIYHLEDYLKELDLRKVAPRQPALTHLYDLTIPFDQLDRDRERWATARAVADRYHRPLWQMECSNYLYSQVEKGSYAEALIWAQHLHYALTAGDCEVVCFWSLFFDKKGEALVFCARTEEPHYEILPVFYTSLNFFRPLRPGMVRCTAACNDGAVLVSAYRAPGPATAVSPATTAAAPATPPRATLVVINPTALERPMTWPTAPADHWFALVTTTDRHNELVAVDAPGAFTLPPQSVVTLIAAPPQPPPPAPGAAAPSPTLDQLCPLDLRP